MNKIAIEKFTATNVQRGSSLIIVMIVLVIVSLLGLGAAQISMMSERGSRNDRDRQVAWQGSDAGMMDAWYDICGNQCHGVVPSLKPPSDRQDIFRDGNKLEFIQDCGSVALEKGLCLISNTSKPQWLKVDFDSASAPVAALGDFTHVAFASGSVGLQPSQKPEYMIEILDDVGTGVNPSAPPGKRKYVYRITSLGYGPRNDIQAVTQILFRK